MRPPSSQDCSGGEGIDRSLPGVDGWQGGQMVGLCQVAPSISANSDLPRLHSADRDGLMREKQRWKDGRGRG